MKFTVETWMTEFGAPVTNDQVAAPSTDADVDVTVEQAPGQWAPITPQVPPAATVVFVDGVERADARLWVDTGTGASRQGVCASWAAGAVRCDTAATVVAAEVRRGLLCPADDIEPIHTRHGDYRPYPVDDSTGDPLSQAIGHQRGKLEARVARDVSADVDLLVVDGPLGDRHHIDGAVGFIKAHHVSYLPGDQQDTVARLGAGQRTPLFRVGAKRFRYSWYLRLPGPAAHAWWGVVRCEVADQLSVAEATERADLVTATLPRFASKPFNDPRAPQNLHPIAGLERELKRRLGDHLIVERGLRLASTGR